MRVVMLLAAVFGVALAATGQRPSDFRSDVLPILEEHCYKCHRGSYVDEGGRTRKPKGGLRLDGAGWIRKGGDEGTALVPGEPRKSPLYFRVILPADDDDRMPQKADPLTGAQIEALRTWIDSGGDFGGWEGEPGGATEATAAAVVAPYVQLIEKLGRGVSPAAGETLARARGKAAQITAVQPGSSLLRVEFTAHETEVGDREVQALGPLRSLVTHLDLGRTKITDRALGVAGDMTRLTRLDLRSTDVTDRGLRSLKGLRELRYLNLYGTAVTDRGLAALADLPSLEAVYLWGTKVSDDGVSALRERLPDALVHHRMVLPDVPPPVDDDDSRPRRRRR